MRLVGYNQNGLRLIGSVSDDMVTPLGRVEDYYRSGGTLKLSGAAPIPLAELELVRFVPVTSRTAAGVGVSEVSRRRGCVSPRRHRRRVSGRDH